MGEAWPYRYFTRAEMSCRHCGQGFHWPEFMQRLERAREIAGAPFHILSAHRCSLHNARIGGAPFSQHLRLAADIATHNHERAQLLMAARDSGFTGFGYYETFLHLDMGRKRHWFSTQRAKDTWQPILSILDYPPRKAALRA